MKQPNKVISEYIVPTENGHFVKLLLCFNGMYEMFFVERFCWNGVTFVPTLFTMPREAFYKILENDLYTYPKE